MRTGSIYIIKNKINDKVYIGQTTMTVHERFMSHKKSSVLKQRSTYKLYNAMNKYGVDNFYVETLEENVPLEKLDELEIKYISQYNSYNDGYNSTPGGDGRIINKINNEEEVLKMAQKGIKAQEIADTFGINKATIFRTLHKLGFYYHASQEEIKELFDLGFTNIEIGELLKCDPDTVTRRLQKEGIRKHRLPLNKRENFDYQGLFNDYQNNFPISKLCEKYDLSESVLRRTLKEHNIPNRTN
jgi:group I intron endonuclease